MSYGKQAQKADTRTEVEILATTRKTLAEADEISTRTLTALNGQTHQLERINADADSIGHNLDQSDRLLKSMKPFGWLQAMFRGEPQRINKHVPAPSGPSASGTSRGSAASSSAGEGRAGAARLLAADAARKNSVGSTAPPGQRSTEADVIYGEIDHMLDNLMHKSLEINRTLDQHNTMIPRINDKVCGDEERMRKQQREIQKIMKR